MRPNLPESAIHEGEPPIVPNRRLAETTMRTQACCYLSTPEHVRSFVGTFFYIYTDKGELTLWKDYLRFTGKNQIPIEIAIKAITDISIGHYSRIAKPMRLDYMAVTYHQNGTERTLLFTPTRSWVTPVWETNKIVNEWVEVLQQSAENDREKARSSGSGVSARLARHGGLSYLEVPAVNAQQSAAFYENVLGWSLRERDSDNPRFEDATGHLIGRWVTDRAVWREPGLLPYFYVDHIDDTVGRVSAHGGEVVKAPYPEGNLWVATVRDPAGNVIGLWQEGPR